MYRFALVTLGILLVGSGCHRTAVPDTHIQVTLNDGQRLIGDMTTQTVELKTSLGPLRFHPSEIGEIGPVEGTDLGESGAAVVVWLRDGSEFVGTWTDPAAAVQVLVGGEQLDVQLPIDRLERLQFTGHPVWPDRQVVRILTTTGDDFLVDTAETRLVLESELGTFRPTFDEIVHVSPPDGENGQWAVELSSGMLLKGGVPFEVLEVRPNMGPQLVSIPIDHLKEIRQESWGQATRIMNDSDWFSNQMFIEKKHQGASYR